MTAEEDYYKLQFNGIITANVEVQRSSTQRITEVSVDSRLTVAVRDEFMAHIELLLPFGGELEETYRKHYDDAHNRLLEIAVNLQAEYGLTDEETLHALELARLDIQQDIRPID